MSLSNVTMGAVYKVNPDMWVCKPDRTAVGKLFHVYDVSLSMEFSAINQLDFTIPTMVEKNHELVPNPLVKKIRERYLIRMKLDGKLEYFVVYKIVKQMANDGQESIRYSTFSLGIQMAGKLLRDEEHIAKNITEMSREIMKPTVWDLDYVDADFDIRYRSLEVSSGNVLQTVFDIATKFNAAITFDTVKQKISYHKPDNIGKDYGLRLKEGKYLESFNLNIDPERIVTRLKVYGEEGLEFRRLSPTGSNYIEDYSFFMYPFECDANYNVIKHSNYMSDALCIAMTKYKKKLESINGQFGDLTKQATDKRAEIQTREQELSVLEAKRNDLLNQRDMINGTYTDKAPERSDWQDVMDRLNKVLAEIDAKNIEIDGLEAQLRTIQASIDSLRETVRVENNFTKEELYEWNKDYIIEAEHTNDSISNEQDLLDEAYNVFEDYRIPPLELNISLDNFKNTFDERFFKGKLNLGDIIYLKSKNLDISVKTKIMGITINFESGDIQLRVSNTVKPTDDMTIYMDKVNIATGTSTTVDKDRWKWEQGKEGYDELTKYLDGVFDAAKQLIQGGLNGSTTLSERGLMSRDLSDTNTFLMITNGQILITPDNGNHVSVAINKDGVHAERLVGRLILGSKLQIEDSEGIVAIQSGRISIYDKANKLKVQLGRYTDPDNPTKDKYGLRVYDGSIDIRTSENQYRGTQIDGNGIRAFNNNGVRTFNVDAVTGMVEIIGSLSIRTSTSTYKGVVIDGDGIKGYNASGGLTFQINNNGNAWFAGRLEWATGNLNDVGGSFTGTLKAVDGVFTGNLSAVGGTFTGHLQAASGTFVGELQAASGTFQGLVTGSLSTQTMRAISIDAQQITTGKITADKMQVSELSAISANLGTVYAGTLNGVNINTEHDLFVGNRIQLGTHWDDREEKMIKFGTIGGGVIQHSGDMLHIGALWGVEIWDLVPIGTLDLRNCKVIGLK